MHVGVCIVSFRNPADIATCLGSLAAQTFADFSVTIWENGGDEAFEILAAATPAVLANGAPVRVWRSSSNIGFPAGVNACVAHSEPSDAYWVLNPDTQPEPEALGALVERLGRGDVGVVGAVLCNPDGSIHSYAGWWDRWLGRAKLITPQTDADKTFDPADIERRQTWVGGACMLISRAAWESVGPMRGEYFIYCEEIEWCLRARARGVRPGFAPAARVMHVGGSTTGSNFQRRTGPTRLAIYLMERNKILLVRDLTPRMLPVTMLLAVPFAAWRYLRYGPRSFLQAMEGWWSGVRNVRGAPYWLGA